MRKMLLAAAVVAIGLAGCGKNYGGLGTVATPTPSPVSTATQATVEATLKGIAQPNVVLTQADQSGNTITTMTTGSNGQALFTGLTPGKYYCWSWIYAPNSKTDTKYNTCTTNWGAGIVDVGT
ncbi:MAG: hypothetical protein ACYDG0_02550 [Vulcanimicrobiaceae bacterium]|jgi:hypothetical protein